MLPKLTKGCCGCSLETTSKIISWLQMFYSCLIMFLAGFGFHEWVCNFRHYRTIQSEFGLHYSDIEAVLERKILSGLFTLAFVMNFVTSICVSVGVYKKKFKLIIVHSIVGALRIFVISFITLIALTLVIVNIIYLAGVPLLVAVNCFEIYSWNVLHSYVFHLKNQQSSSVQTV